MGDLLDVVDGFEDLILVIFLICFVEPLEDGPGLLLEGFSGCFCWEDVPCWLLSVDSFSEVAASGKELSSSLATLRLILVLASILTLTLTLSLALTMTLTLFLALALR